MARVYDTDAFAERVSLACAYIAARKETTRKFDTCFEMYDGDAVGVAVYRRSLRNPRLRANLWRYLGRPMLVELAYRERRRPTRQLSAWAAELRRKGVEESERFFATIEAKRQAEARVELTSIGEQYVIPGCERKIEKPGVQLGLWD